MQHFFTFRYANAEIQSQVVVICGPMHYQLDQGGAPEWRWNTEVKPMEVNDDDFHEVQKWIGRIVLRSNNNVQYEISVIKGISLCMIWWIILMDLDVNSV